jgi:DNA-binding transcriptional ArsR family regulator
MTSGITQIRVHSFLLRNISRSLSSKLNQGSRVDFFFQIAELGARMGSKRNTLGPDGLRLVARLFRILSEPTRLQLLDLLREDEHSVSALVESTGLNQANVSKQLKILADNKILTRRRDGRRVLYRIDDPTILELCELICEKMRHRFER